MDEEINRRKEELITELPKISHKIAMEVLAEMGDEPNDFLDSAMRKMLAENSNLGEATIKSASLTPMPEFALLNAVAVYECFSREFNNQGQKIIEVSAEVIKTYREKTFREEIFSETKRALIDFIKSGEDEEKKRKAWQSLMREGESLLQEILDESPELDPLFATLMATEVDYVLASQEPLIIYIVWAFDTYELLKAQAEANRLRFLMEGT